MKEFEFVGWQLLNPKTGEIKSDIAVIERKSKKIGGKWVRLNQDPMLFLANKKGIRGQTLRVFLFLTGIADFQNLLPHQKEIALKMELPQSHISLAYRQLREIGFICKKEGHYYLSPKICWKGTQKQMEQACRELVEPSDKYLSLSQ